MKTKITAASLLVILFASTLFAQDRTTVSATNFEISDNLDLRAVASIFGEADNLEDFERQLNDPRIQISNLDLNNDNQVDYLRVIESVEYNTHLIIIQSVLGRNSFQDVATIEVEKNRYNQTHVQVVGNVYMYGPNYIYEPVYVYNPVIYSSFWVNHYMPYCSLWYWNYYPTYYYTWNPYPVYRYQNNVNYYVNYNNQCNYVNYRYSKRAVALYENRRSNHYEKQNPNRSFTQRNTNSKNRYELEQNRPIRNSEIKSDVAYNNPRSNKTREYNTPKSDLKRETYNQRKDYTNDVRNSSQIKSIPNKSNHEQYKKSEKGARNEYYASNYKSAVRTDITREISSKSGNIERENRQQNNANTSKSRSEHNSRK